MHKHFSYNTRIRAILSVVILICLPWGSFSQTEDHEIPSYNAADVSIDDVSTENLNLNRGKVNFKIPVASVSSNGVGVGLNLIYSGEQGLKNALYTNKKRPTGIVGLGWELSSSRIVCDNKQTGYRDDDDFYLMENGALQKMICVKKTGTSFYEFKIENLPNWNVHYFKNSNYWRITKDDGVVYYYGDSDPNVDNNANENIIRWNNWIGDSKDTGGTTQSIAWNLSKIWDQWNNEIQLYYETVDRAVQPDNMGPKHTEASYLVSVEATNGNTIEINYAEKTNNASVKEYYEPHTEINEPDAYQEYYQTRYIDDVQLKNRNNNLVLKYDFDYGIFGTGLMAKRYLTKITTLNSANESLRPQIFEYHTSGDFQGALHKTINSMGSVITYSYQNKLLYTNSENRYHPDYQYDNSVKLKSKYLNDNSIFVKTGSDIKLMDWDGQYWRVTEINGDDSMFYENTYFGFQDADADELHLWSKDADGYSYSETIIPLDDGGNGLLKYDDFLLYIKDKIYPIYYDGKKWIKSVGIPFAVDGEGVDHSDINTYGEQGNQIWFSTSLGHPNFHTNVIDGIGRTTNHYILSKEMDNSFKLETFPPPSSTGTNTIYDINFVMEDITLSKNLFRDDFIHNRAYHGTTPRFFSGVNWQYSGTGSNMIRKSYGVNKLFHAESDYVYADQRYYNTAWQRTYDPNTDIVTEYHMTDIDGKFDLRFIYELEDYRFIGNSIFEDDDNNFSFVSQYDTSTFDDDFFQYTGFSSYDKIIMQKLVDRPNDLDGVEDKSWYFYIKKNGDMAQMELPNSRASAVWNDFSPPTYTYTGLSNSALFIQRLDQSSYFQNLYHLYENEMNQDVYDIVVASIDVDNGNGQSVVYAYDFNAPNSLPNNSTYYGETIVENRGDGSSSLGKTYYYYNDGAQDIRLVGLNERTVIKDRLDVTVSESETQYTLNTDVSYDNSNGEAIYIGSHLLPTKKTSSSFFTNGTGTTSLVNIEQFEYNNKGLLQSTRKTNSKGQIEEELIEYAYETSNAFENLNKLDAITKRIRKIDNSVRKVSRIDWQNLTGHLTPYKVYGGPDENNLRLVTEILRVNNRGIVEESSNDAVSTVNLLGYNNRYSVAKVLNSTFAEVMGALNISFSELQNLSTPELKTELMNLYANLPNALITLTFYNENGRAINTVDARQDEFFYYYDSFGRLDYTTDAEGNVLNKNEYNFGN
ncbi:hypothetical protein POV27_00845 [Aureisphaera galaxeae]|uniref:hypothetical protein n=1 Tax=Aureisphaera galaxeae TaxID=1538023 RepID=UPI00234FC433|nr:hypothetical protein [Aureisphaera galaxeae]MDC8002584.1 hypothetical protein [Aureisphaera galaxeae]